MFEYLRFSGRYNFIDDYVVILAIKLLQLFVRRFCGIDRLEPNLPLASLRLLGQKVGHWALCLLQVKPSAARRLGAAAGSAALDRVVTRGVTGR